MTRQNMIEKHGARVVPASFSVYILAVIALLLHLGLSALTAAPRAIAAVQHRPGDAAQPSGQRLLDELAPAATLKGSVQISGNIDVAVVKLDRRGHARPWMRIVTR